MFKGSIPALITPFRDGEVDYAALEELVLWHIDSGSHGIVSCGTTGESPTLSHEEHCEVINRTVRATVGKIPIIASAGSNNTRESILFAQQAEQSGANGLMVVSPYYNKPTPSGVFQHVKAIHDVTNLPIIIYNIPGRSVIDISAEDMAKLNELHRVVGVKDATSDVVRVAEHRLLCGQEFIQLSGEDASALGYNAMGGMGCISVTANVVPALCAEFQQACLDNDYPRALALQDKLMPLHQALFREPAVACVKYALSKIGFCKNEVRLPLTQINQATAEELDKVLLELAAV